MDFSVSYESGLTVYSLILNPNDGTAWDGSEFVDPVWPDFATTITDDGAGTYSGVIPDEVPAGNYLVQAYLQLGPIPSDTDPIVGTGSLFWDAGPLPAAGGFRSGVVSRLNGSAALAACVGDRIFPHARPQRSTLPAVVYRIPSIDRDHDLDGPVGMANGSVELVAYSLDFTNCDQVAEVLRDLFDGFTGLLGDVEVTETVSESEADDYNDPVDGSDDGIHEIQLDYLLTFRESTPNRG